MLPRSAVPLPKSNQRLDGVVVTAEHREAAAQKKQCAGVGLVVREELLRQPGGLVEVTRLGSFAALEQYLL